MEHIWTMLMHKILQNHLLYAFVANLKIVAIYALYPESFCDKNLAIRKTHLIVTILMCNNLLLIVITMSNRPMSIPFLTHCLPPQLHPHPNHHRHPHTPDAHPPPYHLIPFLHTLLSPSSPCSSSSSALTILPWFTILTSLPTPPFYSVSTSSQSTNIECTISGLHWVNPCRPSSSYVGIVAGWLLP